MPGDAADRDPSVILVAEDEPLVRKMLHKVLAQEGYAVLSASSGPEALAIARAYRGPIHLLLTDVKMPGMTGLELAGIFRGERPESRVLVMSAYSSGLISEHTQPENFIRKPFLPEAIKRKIRELLAQPPGEPEEVQFAADISPARRTRIRILIVEDNQEVRRLLRAALIAEGHELTEARSGDLAVSALEAAPEPIDLLLTDVVLPRMNGFELARWARSLHPGIRVVYMSGYLEGGRLELARTDPDAVFLQKPFSLSELVRIVRELASAPPNARGFGG